LNKPHRYLSSTSWFLFCTVILLKLCHWWYYFYLPFLQISEVVKNCNLLKFTSSLHSQIQQTTLVTLLDFSVKGHNLFHSSWIFLVGKFVLGSSGSQTCASSTVALLRVISEYSKDISYGILTISVQTMMASDIQLLLFVLELRLGSTLGRFKMASPIPCRLKVWFLLSQSKSFSVLKTYTFGPVYLCITNFHVRHHCCLFQYSNMYVYDSLTQLVVSKFFIHQWMCKWLFQKQYSLIQSTSKQCNIHTTRTLLIYRVFHDFRA